MVNKAIELSVMFQGGIVSIDEFIKVLSQVQYKQSLDWYVYIFIVISSAVGAFVLSYFKEKGKSYATKDDFGKLQEQLSKNTELVESIKSKLGEKTWINQQVWLKKQDVYESIFVLLFHVKKYVDHQVDDYESYQYIYSYHPSFQNYDKDYEKQLKEMWEKDKKEYEEASAEPELKEMAEDLKKKYESSILELLRVVEIKSIYISPDVESQIIILKDELQKTYQEESWDDHFSRISTKTEEAINNIRDISRVELKIET